MEVNDIEILVCLRSRFIFNMFENWYKSTFVS